MRLTFLTLFIFFTISPVFAQSADWKELYIRMCGADEEDAADILRIEEESEALEAVADNPFNINAITQDELERLTFLSEQDIDAIALYLYRYGKMNSLQELQAIPQLSADKRQLLRYFVYCGEKQTEGKRRFPSGKPVHNAYYSGELMLQKRKGFTTDPEDGGYFGSPYKHQLRYDFQYGDNLRAGIIGAQDSGEPFFKDVNKAGFDYYSFYMQMKGLKLGGGDKRKHGRKGDIAGSANDSRSFWLDNIVAGRFRAGFGMGLVMNNGFSLGKSSMISSGGRISTGLSPHSSTSDENYLQGAGVTFAYRPEKLKDRRTLSLSASLFGSSRYIDATITDSATISTILTSAYHRTRNEINKKNSAVQSTFGGDVSMSYRQFSAGVTAVYTHLNTPLTPNKNPNKTTGADSYRLYYAEGCNFFNASVHYAYNGYKLTFQGETAFAPKNQARSGANASGGVSVATINNLSYRPSYSFKALLLHRYYSYDYTALYAKSLATNSNIQDENGVMASISWQSKVGLTLNYYIDYSHFNHPKYLVSKASNALENSLQASWSHNALKLLLNCRLKNRQYDNADKSGLAWKNTLTLKLQSDYAFSPDYSARLTLQYNRYSKEETQSHGFMVLANGRLKPWRYLCIDVAASYFNTDDYNSVIYAYERALRYRTGYSQYYGKGMHCGLTLSSAATKWLSLGLKFSGTKYFDRSTIGSSMDTIDGSAQATISFEAAVKI